LEPFWQYVMVFLAAAVPVLEVLVVIPGSVAAGLHPVPVGVLAFAGNASTLVLVVLAGDRLAGWISRRRRADADGSGRDERRRARVRRIATRWGLPGVAVLGPLTVGSHAAALSAVALRLPRRDVLLWSVTGVAAWSVVLVGLSFGGRAVL
jgi:Ca2+/H+ antiporter, TMEM165/GDT1 family